MPLDGRVDGPGDDRAQPVGPDHPSRGVLDGPGSVVAADDAVDAAGAIAGDAGDRGAVLDPGSGGTGRVDEDRVEHGPAWSVESVDPVGRLDGDRHLGVRVGERGAAHGWSAGGDSVEKPPAVELDDPGSHERVGGQGVGAIAAAVDDQDVEAGACEEHGGRGPGGTGADYDHVVGGGDVVHVRSLSTQRGAGWRRWSRAPRWRAR